MTDGGTPRIRVLRGTVAVTGTDGEVVEPGGKAGTLLAYLASRAGSSATVNDIIGVVWPDAYDPDLVGRKRVEQVVSEVRGLFGASGRDVLPPRQNDRYRLADDPQTVWIDVVEFERAALAARAALQAGDPASAEALGREALGLWQADPVLLGPEWKRFWERHRDVRMVVAEATLSGPEPHAAVSALRAFVEDYADDERGWELLVEALAKNGQVVDARRACIDASRRFETYGGVGPRLSRMCAELAHPVDKPTVSVTGPTLGAAAPVGGGASDGASEHRRLDRKPAGAWWPARAPMLGATVALVAVALTIVVTVRSRTARQEPTPGPPPPEVAGSLFFDFDRGIEVDAQGGRYVADTTVSRRGYVTTNAGGSITVADRPGHGKAIQFPPRCEAGPASSCPNAIVEVGDAEFLNPGNQPFVYGVDLLLQPDDVTVEANIVQKGLGQPTGGQWKVELGAGGTVRCVLVPLGPTGPVYRAQSPKPIADGAWHVVRCSKTAEALSIEVDGGSGVTVALPAGIVLDSPGVPMRIGGNSRIALRDRFSGALDNVYYRLG